MNTNQIQELIIASAKTIGNLPHLVEPNKSYTPKLGTPYITTSFTVGEPVNRTIGSNRVLGYTGTFTFNVFYKPNSGYNPVRDNIITHFNNRDNWFLDYSNDFKLQIVSAWSGIGLVNDDKSWARDVALLRWRLNQPEV